MSNLFAFDDAVGTTLSDADNEFEEAAAVCRFARAIAGGEVEDDDILDELLIRKLEQSAENVERVRKAIREQSNPARRVARTIRKIRD